MISSFWTRFRLKFSKQKIQQDIHQSRIIKSSMFRQYDILRTLSREITWTFTEIRPNWIFTVFPRTSAMKLAQSNRLHSSLYKKVKSEGSSVPLPETETEYGSMSTDTSQDDQAKTHNFSAVSREKNGNGQTFNVAHQHTINHLRRSMACTSLRV